MITVILWIACTLHDLASITRYFWILFYHITLMSTKSWMFLLSTFFIAGLFNLFTEMTIWQHFWQHLTIEPILWLLLVKHCHKSIRIEATCFPGHIICQGYGPLFHHFLRISCHKCHIYIGDVSALGPPCCLVLEVPALTRQECTVEGATYWYGHFLADSSVLV